MSKPSAPKPPRDLVSWLYWGVLLIVPFVAIWMANKPGYEKFPVLRHDMPAYHLITSADIIRKTVGTNTANVIRDDSRLVNHYTRSSIKANQPIQENQIVPGLNQPLKAVAVAVSASRLTLLTGSLNPGETVNVSVVGGAGQEPQVMLSGVLVLDVLPAENNVVLAIPEDRLMDYLKIRNAPLAVARLTQ